MTETFKWRVTTASSGSGEFAMRTSKFGDGYKQETPAGLNNETQTWNVEVSGYIAQVQPIIDFIRARKGESFFWKSPASNGLKYYNCKKYAINDVGGSYVVFRMDFEQVHLA